MPSIQAVDLPAVRTTAAPYIALIPAAGVGSRMGAEIPKQYLTILDMPVLRHTVKSFLDASEISQVLVVVSPTDDWAEAALDGLEGSERLGILRCGGATRSDTVLHGLRALCDLPLTDSNGETKSFSDAWILVHDAARPGLTPELITHLIRQISDDAVGGLLALPVVDTVKRVTDGKVETIPREGLWLAQTPQMFRYKLLLDALEHAVKLQKQGVALSVTDEASAIEAFGFMPKMVVGHACNLKVTLPSDLAMAEHYLSDALQRD